MFEAAILVILLAIIFTAVQLIRRKAPYTHPVPKGKSGSGKEAIAVVLAMEETGVYMNQQPLVKLQMQVLPDRDRNFVVEVREVLSYVDRTMIRLGSTVKVKYNPSNPKETILLRAS